MAILIDQELDLTPTPIGVPGPAKLVFAARATGAGFRVRVQYRIHEPENLFFVLRTERHTKTIEKVTRLEPVPQSITRDAEMTCDPELDSGPIADVRMSIKRINGIDAASSSSSTPIHWIDALCE